MEPGIDLDITTPRGADTLAHYFSPMHHPVETLTTAAMTWEADRYLASIFQAPFSAWHEEEHEKYIGTKQPLALEDYELDLALSDHSTTTPSDSGGSSSNTFTTGSLTSEASAGYSGLVGHSDWELYTVAYPPSSNTEAESSCAMDLSDHTAASVFGLADNEHPNDSLYTQPGNDILAATVIPTTTFHDTPPQETYATPVRPPSNSPLALSSAPLFSLGDRSCISLSELNPPYIPNSQNHASPGFKMLSTSEVLSAYLSPSPSPQKNKNSVTSRSASLSTQSQETRSSTRAKRRAPSFTSSSSEDEHGAPIAKRARRSTVSKVQDTAAAQEDDGESDVSDSDVYAPSRTPSPDPTESEYSDSDYLASRTANKKGSKLAKEKSVFRMSAADALAQLSHSPSSIVHDDSSIGAGLVVPARRNNPIPVPVPVPHLNKKSRGRKVPYVNARVVKGLPIEDASYDADNDNSMRGGASRRGRGGGRSGSGRSFVCTVEGCGKCFVRGEHLKRHVRSIHTNDKPHTCPYPGCGKSFSRRDNLGQHVRLHLIDSA